MFPLKTKLKLYAASLSLLVCAGMAHAGYPEKSITLVSPYGPGGAADLAARNLAATAPGFLGTEVIVTNRTGAAGVTGSTYVSKSRPNGYTLLLARVGSQAAVPAINHRIPYKWDDFTFLGLLEKNPFALVVNAKSKYQDFPSLVAAIKAGEKLSYASAGVGSLLHIAVVMMLDELGQPADAMRHIPFKGGGKAAASLTGGHVDLMFQNLSGVIGGIKSGQLRAIAVTSEQRFKDIPDVPTVAELGLPDLESVVGWSALYGPKDLPEPVVAKWTKVLGQLKNDSTWNAQTEKLNSIPDIRSAKDTKQFVERQYTDFKDVVDRLGLAIK
ncbi:MAG: tripartite tricarboxylate transporter substrate binding protein [Motiliproteus sp.]